MGETLYLDAHKKAEAEALALFGPRPEWIWTIGTLLAVPTIGITLLAFLGMSTETPNARRALYWTTTLATLCVWLVERSRMRKRDSWVAQREREILAEQASRASGTANK